MNEPQQETRSVLAHDLREAARLLSVSASFLRLEIGRGHLRGSKLGRRLAISHDELMRYLASGSQGSATRRGCKSQ